MKEYEDFYFRKAKSENYPARSVYKLKEIDAKYGILKRGQKVLDLGAAPGSWTLAAAEKIGIPGLVVACDLRECEIEFPACVRFIQGDALNPATDLLAALEATRPFDLVMSDMAPATTGAKFADQARSLELANAAFSIANNNLRRGGNFIVKIFMGPDIQELLLRLRKSFSNVRTFKPKSSRAESKETFFIGLGYRPNAA